MIGPRRKRVSPEWHWIKQQEQRHLAVEGREQAAGSHCGNGRIESCICGPPELSPACRRPRGCRLASRFSQLRCSRESTLACERIFWHDISNANTLDPDDFVLPTGLQLDGSANAIVANNTIRHSEFGLFISDGSPGAQVEHNVITDHLNTAITQQWNRRGESGALALR